MIFSDLLTYFGAIVSVAVRADAAVRVLRHLHPDVVLADVHLPDHDATWLLRRVRRRGVTAPFIAISGADFDEQQLTAQGFEAFLRKPIEHGRLVDTILAVVRPRREPPRL
jgi:two-component system response regulator MprA